MSNSFIVILLIEIQRIKVSVLADRKKYFQLFFWPARVNFPALSFKNAENFHRSKKTVLWNFKSSWLANYFVGK